MTEENSSVSQNEEVSEVFQDDSQEFDVREAFGLPTKAESAEDSEEGEQSVNDKTPAKEDATAEGKKRVVKFNKEDREIDESEVEGLLQKGLALDKERERVKQSQTDLDRAAKLLGYKDHADLSANLETLEKTMLQDQQDKFEKDKQKLIDDLVYNGADEAAARDYVENNPLIQEGRKAIEAQKQASQAQAELSKWNELYQVYPDLEKEVVKGQPTPWYSDEMSALVAKGYSPLHAYQLSNKDDIQQQTKKQAEQKLIKQQQLSSRTKVADNGEQENRASEELRGAFAMFGIDPKRSQKYAK